MPIEVHRRGTTGWLRSVTYVQDVYRGIYGSTIRPNPDISVTSTERNNVINMVAGVTFNSVDSPIFAQNYFDVEITDLINEDLEVPLEPPQIAEIGPLAATGGGVAKTHFLDHLLNYAGIKEAVFTVTPRLASALIRSGRTMRYLGKASSNRLSQNVQDEWGSYYEYNPVVLSTPVIAGNVDAETSSSAFITEAVKG